MVAGRQSINYAWDFHMILCIFVIDKFKRTICVQTLAQSENTWAIGP